MNFERKPQPRWIRCSFAVAAALPLMSLARHYPDEAAQLAQKSLLMAKR